MYLRITRALFAAVLCASPHPCSAQQFSSAQALTQAAETAQGHLSGNAYRIVEQQVEGSTTRRIETQTLGRDFVTTVESGPFTMRYGRFRGQPWQQDFNGVVYSLPKRPALDETPATLSETQIDGHAAYQLERGEGAERVRRFYDKQTLLLMRYERYDPAGKLVNRIEYGEYRNVDGFERAFRVVRTVPEPELVTTTLSMSGVTPEEAPVHIPPCRRIFTTNATKPQLLHITTTQTRIVLQVAVNGRNMNFLLDTGTAGTVITPEAARDAQLTIENQKTVAPSISVGGFQAQNVVMSVGNVGERVRTMSIAGLIGADFLASNVTQLDAARETLVVYPPGTFQPATSPIDFVFQRGWIYVPGWIEEHQGIFVLDTGSPRTSVTSKFARTLPLEASGFVRDTDVNYGDGHPLAAKEYAVRNIVFAGTKFDHGDVLIEQVPDPVDRISDGTIGLDLIKHYKITFDYEHELLYVEPE